MIEDEGGIVAFECNLVFNESREIMIRIPTIEQQTSLGPKGLVNVLNDDHDLQAPIF